MPNNSSRRKTYGIAAVGCSAMLLAWIMNSKSSHIEQNFPMGVGKTEHASLNLLDTGIVDSEHEHEQGKGKVNSIQDESLPAEAEAKYFAQIDKFFGGESANLNVEARKMEIAAINGLGRKGVASILKRLVKLERSDKEAVENISLVDYTSYRLRWDPKLRQEVAELVIRKIPESTSLRSRASLIAERAELVRSLGVTDKDLAVKTVNSIDDQKLKAYAMESLLESFMDDGLDYNSAMERMRQEFPNYSRKEIAPPAKVNG